MAWAHACCCRAQVPRLLVGLAAALCRRIGNPTAEIAEIAADLGSDLDDDLGGDLGDLGGEELRAWLWPELRSVVADELRERAACRAAGVPLRAAPPAADADDVDSVSRACVHCGALLYLSAAVCGCGAGHSACLRHRRYIESCPGVERARCWCRHSDATLRGMCDTLSAPLSRAPRRTQHGSAEKRR